MDFGNKRHRFLAPIVSEFRQSGPLGWTFETNGTSSSRRLFQKSARAGRGRPVVTGRWDGLLKEMVRLNSLCRLFQKSARAGRGRPVVTGRWDGLLKQTARIPYADCCKNPPERAVGCRAAGMDF